jgi:SAM-dependent methyltransferase
VDDFLHYYGQVRKAELWGSTQIEYYLHLPFRDVTRRYSSLWKVRAITYQTFIDDLKSTLPNASARILDLGAGNCWLSYRLAQHGYDAVASDINLDARDGLLVAPQLMQHSGVRFRCVRSEFDYLPFPDGSFDAIIFNATLHYSSNPVQTIQRTLPLLSSQGTIYVLDSPYYSAEESGMAMVRERIGYYETNFSIEPPAKPVQSYLTFSQVEEIRALANVITLEPTYSLLWKIRPWLASLFRRRQPAVFFLLKITRRSRNP